MEIKFIEVQNFRKLKSTRIDFDNKTTIFVGSNNSGKTSAIVAMEYFLSSPKKLSLSDITIDNLSKIDQIGEKWTNGIKEDIKITDQYLSKLLPKMDVWLNVPIKQIHQVIKILPTLDWKGGLLGIRLQYHSENIEVLKSAYLEELTRVKEVTETHKDDKKTLNLWPRSLSDFLNIRLTKFIKITAFPLDPNKIIEPKYSIVRLQSLPEDTVPFEGSPLTELIKIDQTGAQRGLSDKEVYTKNSNDSKSKEIGNKKKLSDQLRSYYDQHLNPKTLPTSDDLEALIAIQSAEEAFDSSLKSGFKKPFEELEDLGYPGITNPKISVSTEIKIQDSLNHGSAVQYDVSGTDDDTMLLPENHVGLGFQNLISMVFDLMSYRDDWMQVGNKISADKAKKIEPIHLVLIEEPEAHLHAQVQQVFIKKAYSLLRKHDDLGENTNFHTQLVISTHSSHVAYEADFSCLRYFKRQSTKSLRRTSRTSVVNLSSIFSNPNEEQRFVAKYLKVTHCDLFFADAVIFIEGQAEKLLLPEFIKSHYPNLHKRYYSLIDVSGSYAQKFRKVIEALGIATLVITDLDSVIPTISNDKNGKEITRGKAIAPAIKSGQLTANSVLKEWHPKLSNIDDLLNLKDKGHIVESCKGALYIAFQKEVKSPTSENKYIPRTFEDALIFENDVSLKEVKGNGTTAKVKKLVSSNLTKEEFTEEIYSLVRNAKKGNFAIDCLMLEMSGESSKLVPPQYISKGLIWLENYLDENPENVSGEI